MLTHLLIKNYALIEHLEFSLSDGLTIITGETGAGKSILLGAIGLLQGNRADTKALHNPTLKCIIEGTFDSSGYALESLFEEAELDYAQPSYIRREISPNGKSRAFVNDTPVTLDLLKRISDRLLDIHSQHDSILLGQNEFQLDIVDAVAGSGPLLQVFQQDFGAFKDARQELETLQAESSKIRKELDYHHFLLTELTDASLQPGEQASLENELALLEHATEIKSRLLLAGDYLDNHEHSVLSVLKEALTQLKQATRLVPAFQPLADRTESALLELKDLAAEIAGKFTETTVSPERLSEVNERLNLLYQLQKKHQTADVEALIGIRDQLQEQIDKALNLDADLSRSEQRLAKAGEQLDKSARQLSVARKAALPALEAAISGKVKELGIPDATFTIRLQAAPVTKNGIDLLTFLFSANKGIPPQELRQVASGGEFSRLMLVIKSIIATKRQLPTIIFDEIDTGISGEIAVKMGEMIDQMSKNHQILAITHLHQIAARGKEHYYVFKDNSGDKTISKIKKITGEERVLELAQMIGGQHPSPLVISNARELLSKSV